MLLRHVVPASVLIYGVVAAPPPNTAAGRMNWLGSWGRPRLNDASTCSLSCPTSMAGISTAYLTTVTMTVTEDITITITPGAPDATPTALNTDSDDSITTSGDSSNTNLTGTVTVAVTPIVLTTSAMNSSSTLTAAAPNVLVAVSRASSVSSASTPTSTAVKASASSATTTTTTPDYMSVVSKWRAAGNLPLFMYDSGMESIALQTVTKDNGTVAHYLGTSLAQVMAPGTATNFENVYVGGWLCEVPTLPYLNGICATIGQGWVHTTTEHEEILTSTVYTKIGCALYAGLWACNLE